MTTAEKTPQAAKSREAAAQPAEIVREYGPFPGADKVAGVSHDGQRVWFAGGDRLVAFDPDSGQVERTLARAGQSRRAGRDELSRRQRRGLQTALRDQEQG